MDQSTTTTTNISAAGPGPDTVLGGIPPAAPAGGADIGGAAPRAADSGGGAEHGGELMVGDGSSKRRFDFLAQLKMQKERMVRHKGNITEFAGQMVEAVQPVRAENQKLIQRRAVEEILVSGVDGNGIKTMMQHSGTGVTKVHHGDITVTSRSEKAKKQQDPFNNDYRIQLDNNPAFDPDSNCTALRLSSGFSSLAPGNSVSCVTYKVMTLEEIQTAGSRAEPGPPDNYPHCYITRHEFSVVANRNDKKELKSCQLNLKPTLLPFPDPINLTRETLFQKQKLNKYGVVHMYGLKMPGPVNTFRIVGDPTVLKSSISFKNVVILPETTNGAEFHKFGSSLSFHMPHNDFQKTCLNMLRMMGDCSTAMSSKKVSFAEWLNKAKETGAVIYRFSFITLIGHMVSYQGDKLDLVFSNCSDPSQLRCFRMSASVVMQPEDKSTGTSKSKQKSAVQSLNLVWNSYGYAKGDFQVFLPLYKYFEHFKNNVATIETSTGKSVRLKKDQMNIKSINSTWPPGPSGKLFWLRDTAEVGVDGMISYIGPQEFRVAEDMQEELNKITEKGGEISNKNMLIAMSLSLHRANNVPKLCVYPNQHCFTFSMCSQNDLASTLQTFFSYLSDLTHDTVMGQNILEEKFLNEGSVFLYYKQDNNFVNFLLHFLLSVLFTHGECETEIDMFELCKNNIPKLQKSCVYDDESLSNDHKLIFFVYFSLSIMMTILRTIDFLLFIPRKVPLKYIRINSYNRSVPWYLLAVQNIRSSGVSTYRKTPYPNEIFFAPVHAMCWLTMISFRLSEERTTQSTAEILRDVLDLSADDLKKKAEEFLGKLYDQRAGLFTHIINKSPEDEEAFKEKTIWDDTVDSYTAPDAGDFSPSSTPTDLGLKGTWFPPPAGDAPEPPSKPYKTVTDEELGNERPANLALPPPSEPAAMGAAGGAAAASARPVAPAATGPGNA